MKHISILGSTGSIGTQCADVAIKTGCTVDYICFGNDIKKAEEQIRMLRPKYCAAASEKAAELLKNAVRDTGCKVYGGRKSSLEIIGECSSDVIFNAVSGKNGLDFTVEALKTGERLGLANKESMVIAGDIVNSLAEKYGSRIIPVDSEHSAIFQCLQSSLSKPKKILLTASGGPFYGMKKEEVAGKTADEALKHPNWNMGQKILVDSATLANKGLEFIEAIKLFGVTCEQIKVIIQRQSVIHSMVEFSDNAVIAQMGVPDMRLCIEYAITYPKRGDAVCEELDWDKIEDITIGRPDPVTFPMLPLAIECAKYGKSAPVVYNAANEIAVSYYLRNKIGFYGIYDITCACVNELKNYECKNLDDVEFTDNRARELSEKLVKQYLIC